MEDYVEMSNHHVSELRKKTSEELSSLEEELLSRRKKMIEENEKVISELFQKQAKQEEKYVKQKENAEDRFLSEVKRLKQVKYKEYFDLKLTLENEIESHQKCLEDMRAIYNLNSEKLNYNFKVLSGKKDESKDLSETLRKKERFYLGLLKVKRDQFLVKGEKNNFIIILNNFFYESKRTKQMRSLI